MDDETKKVEVIINHAYDSHQWKKSFQLNRCILKSFFPSQNESTLCPQEQLWKKWRPPHHVIWDCDEKWRTILGSTLKFPRKLWWIYCWRGQQEETKWPVSPPGGDLWEVQLYKNRTVVKANWPHLFIQDRHNRHPSPFRSSLKKN